LEGLHDINNTTFTPLFYTRRYIYINEELHEISPYYRGFSFCLDRYDPGFFRVLVYFPDCIQENSYMGLLRVYTAMFSGWITAAIIAAKTAYTF
jgi:hypothetical protein